VIQKCCQPYIIKINYNNYQDSTVKEFLTTIEYIIDEESYGRGSPFTKISNWKIINRTHNEEFDSQNLFK
jgi:hypothetical protein